MSTVSEPALHLTPDGTSIAVRSIPGRGNPLVVLHGFTGDGTTMAELTESARAGRPAALIDLVGHGASEAPERLEPYMMASVVDQVLSIVGTREYGTVHLLGYSLGGRVALSMAARAPWYFASVTSVSSTAGIADPGARQERLDADHVLADRIDSIGVDAFVEEWLALPLFAPMIAAMSEEERRASAARRAGNTAHGLANSLRGTGAGAMPPVWDALVSLRSPLLAVSGALDPKYVDIGERLAAGCPDGRHRVVPDAGHALPVENPAAVATLVAEFLEGCDGASH